MEAHESEPLEVQQMRPKLAGPMLKLIFSLGAVLLASFKLCTGGSPFGRGLGEQCTKGEDCRSGSCLTSGIFGTCSKSCKQSDPSSCPAGLDCARMAGGYYCHQLLASGELCTTSDECKSRACLPDADAKVMMGHLIEGSAHCAAQ